MLSLILLIIDRPSTLSKQSGNVWKRQKIAINPEYKNLPRKKHPTRSFLRFFLKDKLLNEMSVVYSFLKQLQTCSIDPADASVGFSWHHLLIKVF